MLKHHLLIAFRSLRRRPGTTAINVVGLAVGVACCLTVYALVTHETSFDAHHAHANRTYRVGALWLAGLQAFAVRTEPSLWLLGACALGMAALALGVVASQTLRAATRDPVEALRYE